MATQDLELRIKQILQGGNVWKNLNKEITDVKNTLAKLNLEGKQGTPEFKRYEAILQGLNVEKAKLNAHLKSLNPQLHQTSSGFQSIVDKSQVLYNGVMAAGLTQIAKQLYDISLNSAKFEVLSDSFGKQFNGNVEIAEKQLSEFRTATAGTVTDGNLIKLSNQASDLGIGLKEQTILFALAEDAADKYGTSTEEGFQKVVLATEGSAKGLKGLGIQKEVYEKIVNDLALAHGKNINALDAETQKQIRIQAIIQASGITYEDATNKVKDSADKHESLFVIVGNLADRFGGEFVNAITGVGTAWEALNYIIDGWNKVIEVGIPLIDGLSNKLLQFTDDIHFIGSQLAILKNGFDNLFGTMSQTANRTINIPNVSETVKKFVNQYRNSFNSLTEAKDYARSLGFTDEQIAQFEGVMGFGNAKENEASNSNRTNTTKGTRQNTSTKKKEELNFLEEFRKKIVELENEIKELNTLLNDTNLKDYEKLAINEEIVKKQEELNKLKKEELRIGQAIQRQDRPDNKPSERNNKPVPQPGGKNRGGRGNEQEEETKSPKEYIDEAINGFSGMVSDTQTMLENFGLMDTTTGRMINAFSQIVSMIQSLMNVGSGIFDIITGIAGFFLPGASLIGKAIPRASGGSVRKGMMYLTGEQGIELFTPNINGTITSNRDLTRLINNGSMLKSTKPNVSVNIQTEFDRVKSYEVVYEGSKMQTMRGSNNL